MHESAIRRDCLVFFGLISTRVRRSKRATLFPFFGLISKSARKSDKELGDYMVSLD